MAKLKTPLFYIQLFGRPSGFGEFFPKGSVAAAETRLYPGAGPGLLAFLPLAGIGASFAAPADPLFILLFNFWLNFV